MKPRYYLFLIFFLLIVPNVNAGLYNQNIYVNETQSIGVWHNITAYVQCLYGNCTNVVANLSYASDYCGLNPTTPNVSINIGNLSQNQEWSYIWIGRCTISGTYNWNISFYSGQNNVSDYDNATYYGGGGLTPTEHAWLQAIYNEVRDLQYTMVYIVLLICSVALLITYAFKRTQESGAIYGLFSGLFFMSVGFTSFSLIEATFRPLGVLFVGISIVILLISMFDVVQAKNR